MAAKRMKQAAATLVLIMLLAAMGTANAGAPAGDGFLGQPWGTKADALSGARHSADIADGWSVYVMDADLSPLLGTVRSLGGARLVVSRSGGLEAVYITVPDRDYGKVESHLTEVLGQQTILVYSAEVMNNMPQPLDQALWHRGKDTAIELTRTFSGAVLTVRNRSSAAPRGRLFEQSYTAALMQKGEEYERQYSPAEASSVYQELLNRTERHHLFTHQAVSRLAELSTSPQVSEVLAFSDNRIFRGLKSQFIDQANQLWLRIDFEAASPVSAALCRVRAGSGDELQVLEEVWLNSDNEVIATKWAFNDELESGSARQIKEVCEDFLRRWFQSVSEKVTIK